MAQRAQRLYQAQETRWRREKILTARAQYSRSTAPWEVYDSLFANGYAWNTLADDGRYAPELALLSTRAIFGLWALWDTRYTDALHLGRLHQDEKRGWFEGRYEANGGYNATFTSPPTPWCWRHCCSNKTVARCCRHRSTTATLAYA